NSGGGPASAPRAVLWRRSAAFSTSPNAGSWGHSWLGPPYAALRHNLRQLIVGLVEDPAIFVVAGGDGLRHFWRAVARIDHLSHRLAFSQDGGGLAERR